MARTKVLLTLVVLLLAIPITAQEHMRGCSNRSAQGSYGYSCNGVAANPFDNFLVEPFAAYGMVASDGKGQWHGYGKVSYNGSVHAWTHDTRPDGGSIVNADCTGSVTYQVTVDGSAVPDAHFEFVIVDNGDEIKGFPVDQGFGMTCQLVHEK